MSEDIDPENLKRRIAEYEEKHREKREKSPVEDLAESQRGLSFAVTIVIEMIVPVAVGGIIGHQIDLWIGKKALFVLIFVLLGLVVAIIQVKRIAEGQDTLSPLTRKRHAKKTHPQDHG